MKHYNKDWYDSLVKPQAQPPEWVFAPVWLLLYCLMAISFLLVVIKPFKLASFFSYIFFIFQLIVNLQWPVAFFKEHDLRRSFLLCALLNFLVFLTMLAFFHVSKLAGIMFLPYFLWCCFATYLMFEILELNEW